MKSVICHLATESALLLCAVACFGQTPTNPYAGPQHSRPQPRVYLESVSIGSNRNASRDQSMEMAKDFLKVCSDVKITINLTAADYTIRLNHIEHGLLYRDNQIEVFDRNGDLLHNKEGGSIKKNVQQACDLIHSNWATDESGSGALDAGQNQGTSGTSNLQAASNISAQRPARAERKTVASQPSQPSQACDRGSEAAMLGVMVCSADGGLRVTSVRSGSPAARAAILPGDIVTSIDGRPVRTSNDIETAIAASISGTVKVGYMVQGNFLVEHEAKVR
jgi:PDZ domain